MEKNIETILVKAGRKKKYTQGAINPIVQRTSSIIFDSIHHKNQASKNNNNYELFYGRKGTLTHFSLQKAMLKLENGFGCALYPCGTAAITHSILSFISAGDHILITNSAYEPTQNFCQYLLHKMNVTTTWFNPLIGDKINTLIQNNTRLILLESPGSITMEIEDIPTIINSIRYKNPNIIILLDNTWSAGVFLKPLDMGIDISIQSGTKYIIGHSDAMIGTAVANQRCWTQLREHSYLMGQTIDPDTAYLATRGLRTLYTRLKQHEKNGLMVARWLSSHPQVARVNHPALPSCTGHEYFTRDFTGSCGLFSFILKKRLNNQQLDNYINNFQHFQIAYSWGGFESLILAYQVEELQKIRKNIKLDFTGTLIRLHIGLENVDDLIYDLDNAFKRIL
ncbi:Cystathionine beta-lyase metC [Blochmannia endosymbiont of Polyrhachis (Hedomyrma) turneri]|nr:Cystathionine beta-lyase metC [Blochmannia endosymbiont of Polyrhachis (Hedomyrma) turneri]